MSELAAIENRVTRLENVFADGLARIEALIRGEITDLKNEQIADLREANRRLADDQRRLWEALRIVENRESQRTGSDRTSGKAFTTAMMFLSASLAGFISWAATMLGVKPHP